MYIYFIGLTRRSRFSVGKDPEGSRENTHTLKRMVATRAVPNSLLAWQTVEPDSGAEIKSPAPQLHGSFSNFICVCAYLVVPTPGVKSRHIPGI